MFELTAVNGLTMCQTFIKIAQNILKFSQVIYATMSNMQFFNSSKFVSFVANTIFLEMYDLGIDGRVQNDVVQRPETKRY